ncbi:MAG: NADH dehydrogenase subunit [Halobacteriales archaeon]
MSDDGATAAAADLSDIASTIQRAGVAGAGGAGFPSYAKWERVDEVDHLMVNHQESEPTYYIDKWLGKTEAEAFGDLFEALLETHLQTVVVGCKEKYREEWMGPLEEAAPGTVYTPDELPVDADDESGVVYAYTVDNYQLGMESVLLNMAADTVIGKDLPMDHGWIVQNTETLYNIHAAITEGVPVTSKWVHAAGNVPQHRFLEVPVGTPARDILAAGGLEEVPEGQLVADGGPGWCFACERDLDVYPVSKRTNALLVLDEDVVEENTLGQGRINVLEAYDWDAVETEREPTERLEPDRVYVPRITNPDFEGIVTPAEPVVAAGDTVAVGDVVAEPGEGISTYQHASIDGTVADVTDDHVVIDRD